VFHLHCEREQCIPFAMASPRLRHKVSKDRDFPIRQIFLGGSSLEIGKLRINQTKQKENRLRDRDMVSITISSRMTYAAGWRRARGWLAAGGGFGESGESGEYGEHGKHDESGEPSEHAGGRQRAGT
jgi:hypothetical protein